MIKTTHEIELSSTGTIVGVIDADERAPGEADGIAWRTDPGVFDTRRYDRVSAYVEFPDSSVAVVEIKKNHTGRKGDGVAFDAAEQCTAAAPENDAIDIGGAPAIELEVTTADAGKKATLHLYRYSSNQ